MTFTHSQTELDNVRAMLAAGRSLSQIGKACGMTRSAASGLVHRMKTAKSGMAVPSRLRRVKPKPRIVRPPQQQRSSGMCDLPVEPIPATAVTLIELGDNGCHWPVAGEGVATLFCGADRDGSWHASYCRHHQARSVAIDGPRVFAAYPWNGRGRQLRRPRIASPEV
jgi:hypothetical protein